MADVITVPLRAFEQPESINKQFPSFKNDHLLLEQMDNKLKTGTDVVINNEHVPGITLDDLRDKIRTIDRPESRKSSEHSSRNHSQKNSEHGSRTSLHEDQQSIQDIETRSKAESIGSNIFTVDKPGSSFAVDNFVGSSFAVNGRAGSNEVVNGRAGSERMTTLRDGSSFAVDRSEGILRGFNRSSTSGSGIPQGSERMTTLRDGSSFAVDNFVGSKEVVSGRAGSNEVVNGRAGSEGMTPLRGGSNLPGLSKADSITNMSMISEPKPILRRSSTLENLSDLPKSMLPDNLKHVIDDKSPEPVRHLSVGSDKSVSVKDSYNYFPGTSKSLENDREEIMWNLQLLRKYSNTDLQIPDRIDLELKSVNELKNILKKVKREVILEKNVSFMNHFLINALRMIELGGTQFLSLNLSGFADHERTTQMDQYRSELIELSQKSYVNWGESTPVELRILLIIASQVAAYLHSNNTKEDLHPTSGGTMRGPGTRKL